MCFLTCFLLSLLLCSVSLSGNAVRHVFGAILIDPSTLSPFSTDTAKPFQAVSPWIHARWQMSGRNVWSQDVSAAAPVLRSASLPAAAYKSLRQQMFAAVTSCFLGVAERFWFHRWTGFLADLTAEWKWRRNVSFLLEGGEQRRFNYTESAGVYINLRFYQILSL